MAGSDTIPAETLDPQKERKVERRPGVYGAKQNKERHNGRFRRRTEKINVFIFVTNNVMRSLTGVSQTKKS